MTRGIRAWRALRAVGLVVALTLAAWCAAGPEAGLLETQDALARARTVLGSSSANEPAPGTLRLLYASGRSGLFAWSRASDGALCFGGGVPLEGSMAWGCLDGEERPPADPPQVRDGFGAPLGEQDFRWLYADGEQVRAVSCAGGPLTLVEIGARPVGDGVRTFYFVVRSPAQWGRVVLTVTRPTGEATEEAQLLGTEGQGPDCR